MDKEITRYMKLFPKLNIPAHVFEEYIKTFRCPYSHKGRIDEDSPSEHCQECGYSIWDLIEKKGCECFKDPADLEIIIEFAMQKKGFLKK